MTNEAQQVLSPDELKLLSLYRQHPREDIIVIHRGIDEATEFSYIIADNVEDKYVRVSSDDLMEKARMLRFLESIIAIERGIPVEQVTEEYIDNLLQESREYVKKFPDKPSPPTHPPHNIP